MQPKPAKACALVAGVLLAAFALPLVAHGALILNLDINKSSGNHYSGTAVAPDSGGYWNSFLVPAAPSLTLTGVRDSGSNLTAASITITRVSGSNFSSWDNAGGGGNPNPLALMRDYLYGGPYQVAISNLPPGTYSLYVYAHGDNTGQSSSVALAATNGGASGNTTDVGEYRNLYQAGAGGNSYLNLTGSVGEAGVFSFTTTYLNGFQLQLLSAPLISGLTNQTVVAGTMAVLNPTVTGTPPPAFQWRSNHVAIPDATNAALTLNNVQYAQDGTVYSLVASNVVGVVTNAMTLAVIVTPGIAGLNNQAVAIGANLTNAPVVSGVPPPVTRWQFNSVSLSDGVTARGSTISGSATSTLILANAQTGDSGSYSLIASNNAGSVTNSMTLTVSSGSVAPGITGPTDQTVVQGSNATFSTSVSGLPVPVLQWRLNGTNLPGATDSSLTVSNVQYAQDNSVYSLVASNSAGMITNSATLHVLVPPVISHPPNSFTVTAGMPASFSVTASGVPAVAYRWSRNGVPIANATNASYILSGPQGADNGAVFAVTVSNSVGVVVSSNVTLTVLSTMTGTLLPTNGAGNIAPDQQLRIVFSSPPKLGSGKLHIRDAADNSLFATVDTAQFQTFSLFSATITNAAIRSVQSASYYYLPIALYGNEAWITLNPSNRFAYNKTYYVTADTGLFRDASNASFPAITGTNTWRFSTRPSGPATSTASTGPTNLTVALDGAGDFATLQGAADWIPQNNSLLRTITLLPGVYRDNATFAQTRNKVRIIGGGADRRDVQLFYPYPAFSSANGAGTLRLESSDVYVRNLTIDNAVYLTNNGVVFAGPIQTVQTTGNRIIFDNVLIKGGQDTLYTISGITYFNRCEIWGSVDFIYGAALAVFDACDIVQIRNTGGPITAPNTDLAAPHGMVFLNSRFPRALVANGYPYDVGVGTTTFQRPWRQDGYTAIINCAVGSHVSTKGWSEWGNRHTTCRVLEAGTTLIGGGTVTPAQRQAAGAYWLNTADPDYTNNPAIDPDVDPEMALLIPPDGPTNRFAVTVNTNDFTLDAIFGHPYYGLGTWRPALIPTITAQPANQTVNAGDAAVFTVAAVGQPAPMYQWLKNGTNLAGATNATLMLANVQPTDAGTYAVIVSSSAGAVVSTNATLTVAGLSAPQIITQPTNQTSAVGGTVSFVVAVAGVPAPTFQWWKNGVNLPNATNAALTLSNVQVTDIAVYAVTVSNGVGTVTSSNATFNLSGANGFAMINGTTTGGEGGMVVTVTNGADFNTQINVAGPRIIQVQGPISIGRIFTTANKTIVGLGTNAMLHGNLNISGVTNVIIQNLRVSNPGGDGLTIWNARNVWVDHCTFYDNGDGACDMNNGSQYVTVSWCKFLYPTQQEHRFTMIADGQNTGSTTNIGYFTLHHNWWGARADQRMAASSYGRVHYYNNFFNCTNNSYSSNARNGTEINSENNFYSGVKDPMTVSSGTDGRIKTSGNLYDGCTGTIHPGANSVFTPPYGYLLDATVDVSALVMSGAGASGPDTVPIPPKVWDGGGANNSLNNASNWGFNESPKEYDTLLFAGGARLTPNNDFVAASEFHSLVFSNNAGAFVLGGNTVNFGNAIIDDSPSVQTLNLNLDFSYAIDHFPMGREFKVTRPDGALVINGNIAGTTNIYNKPYVVSKTGPGLLVLAGVNSFPGSFQFNEGLVRFAAAGNFSNVTSFTFSGGGLQWASGNTTDISTTPVIISAGGATFDVGVNNVVFANPVGLGGAGGITKTGSGRLTLNGDYTFNGLTLVNQGTLALGTTGALPNSPQLVLTNNAALDVSGRVDGTLALGSGKTLRGNGSVLGSVTAAGGATVTPGFPLGALVVTNVLTFQSGSTNLMDVDAAAHANDLITGMTSVSYGGRLVLTNLGGTLAAGDSFKLFGAGSYIGAFSSIIWPPLAGSLYWTNRLAVDGTIAVASPVNLTPTNLTFTLGGEQLQLSWPADHTGWRIEVQTNPPAVGLGTNWVAVSGSAETNWISFPVNAAGGSVFYRMVYP